MSDTIDHNFFDVNEKARDELQVLSVQSWVCHGYVGNKCSVFGLQVLGVEVDPILTVQFSNHTGYPSWKGEILNGDQLSNLFEGLVINNLTWYSHLLTGYINSPTSLRNLMKILTTIKEKNPQVKYYCDPVMGDNGKLYVPQELANIYRDEVIKNADFLFPNQTECEVLTGITISSESDAIRAIDKLHDIGIPNVIITSLFYEKSDNILLLGSTKSENVCKRFRMRVQRLHRNFTGTGDLFAALMLAWTSILKPKSNSVTEGDITRIACEKSINTLQAILKRTLEADSTELKLIQSKKDIENPPAIYRAEIVE